MNRRVRVLLIALALVVTASAFSATPSMAASVRVPADYYGINYFRMNLDPPTVRDQILNAIKDNGFDQVRFTIPWVDIEPTAPQGGVHTYQYIFPDDLVRSMAIRGLTGQVTFWKTPAWNVEHPGIVGVQCHNSKSQAPSDLQAYALAAAAVVRRYGPQGTFWSDNPALPFKPIRVFEVWNEENLTGAWCPNIEPGRYARMLAMTANSIHNADPSVKVVFGGLPLGTRGHGYMKPGDFMSQALAESPQLPDLIDSVGIHVYPFGGLDQQLDALTSFRKVFQGAGLPDSTPLTVNELGWSTAGTNPVTEDARVARYRVVPAQIPRTNCNVDSVIAHAWTTDESDLNNNQDFFGIASPTTGLPYPSGVAYEDTIALMRGETAREAPHGFIDACDGMPEPDQDGDGHTDAHDYYPFDPTQWQGPPGWDDPPPAHPHQHARKACRRWYRWSKAWIADAPGVHRTIFSLCIPKYLALKKTGELAPLRTASRQKCKAVTPPPSNWEGRHGVKRRRSAVKHCTFRKIRKAFAIGY